VRGGVKDRSTDYFGARATITNAEDLAARSSCVWRLMARRRVTLAGCPDPGQRRTLPLLVLFLKEHSLGALLQQPRNHQYLYNITRVKATFSVLIQLRAASEEEARRAKPAAFSSHP